MHEKLCVQWGWSNYRLQNIQLSRSLTRLSGIRLARRASARQAGLALECSAGLFDAHLKLAGTRLVALQLVKASISGPVAPQLAQQAEAGPQAASMPVVIGSGSHPFPFRTRKLSLIPPMVLHAQVCGRVGRCRD